MKSNTKAKVIFALMKRKKLLFCKTCGQKSVHSTFPKGLAKMKQMMWETTWIRLPAGDIGWNRGCPCKQLYV